MIKEETVRELVIRKKKIFICDICADSATYNSGCCGVSDFMKCDICGRLVCRNCRYLEWKYNGDYPDGRYCIECWELGKHYRKRISRLENRIDELDEEWRKVARRKYENDM